VFGYGAFHFGFGEEGSGALVGGEEAGEFEFAIGADYGVGVDFEVDGELADGGEALAWGEGAGGTAGVDLVDDLAVDGDAGFEVEAEDHLLVLIH